MKTKLFLVLLAVIGLMHSISFAQNAGNSNPYAIFGRKPYIAGDVSRQEQVKVLIIENFHDGSTVSRLEHDTQTGMLKFFDSEGILLGEKQLAKGEQAWLAIDKKAEKYYSISPYAFTLNNPIRYIDPDGMDVYRYDDKTGDMILHKQTNDDFDQIGRFKYDKKTDTYTLRTNRKGEARTRMDNVEKGILSDGMNFMMNDNMWEIGSAGQPTVEGFQNFVIGFADMIGKEVAGFYFSQQGQNDVSHIYMGRHINNSLTESKTGLGPYALRPELQGIIQPHTSWHTHPSHFPDVSRLEPSGRHDGRGDIGFKRSQSVHGFKYFIILTGGYPPIHY